MQNGKSQDLMFRIDRVKAQAAAEYSGEKDRYIRYELASHSSKRDSCPNSMSDSVKGKKEDYDYYIDRPFNSIDGIYLLISRVKQAE